MIWYLDCYCYAACGKEFPVNSYQSESVAYLAMTAAVLLMDEKANIDEIRIGRKTNAIEV